MADNYILSDVILFDAKPDAVPYNYRISYKLAQLCLIVSMCCRGGCSLVKLHMISISLCAKDAMKQLIELANDRISDYTIVRFDPAVNRAIKFAISDKLLFQQQNGLFRLTEKGKQFVAAIKQDESLLISEKTDLTNLSNVLTEDRIKNIMASWRYSNAKN